MEKRLIACFFSIFWFFISLSFVLGEVRINEASPATPEYIEIYNTNNEILNLSEWQIKDNSTDNPDTITCYTIPNCSLTTNESYFLILGRNTNISSITNQTIFYFYVDDTQIGNNLNDLGDNITFYNSSFSISFSYNSSTASKSWQYCNGNWTENPPTPGTINNCTSLDTTSPIFTDLANQTIQYNQSLTYDIDATDASGISCFSVNDTTEFSINCSGYLRNATSLSIGLHWLNITINDTYNNKNSGIIYVNVTNASTSTTSSSPNLFINLSWGGGDIIGGSEFDIEVKAFNLLNYSYDIKVWLEFEENDTIISDRYDENESKWKSGTYFVDNFFFGSGNKTKEIKLRLREAYTEFYGGAKLYAKIRYDDDTLANVSYSIEILENTTATSSNDSATSAATSLAVSANSTNNTADNLGGVIKLGSKTGKETEDIKTKNSIVYKSKNEYIKEYAIYGFAILCVFLIILLLIDKK